MTEWLSGGGALEATSALALIVLAGFTSFLTATMGIGGGVLLLVVMASMVPVAALIPVHGLVQLGSNANRAVLTRQHLDQTMFGNFGAGALLGAVVASLVVVQLPLVVIEFAVAAFILFLVWGLKPQAREMSRHGQIAAGFGTTVLSMFVGATGPLVAAFVHRNQYDKMQLTATFAACMTFQHCLKVFVFTFVGFQFFTWLPLIVLMVLSGFVGTWLGLKMLHHIPTETFRWVFKVVVSLLALRLLWQAVMTL